jgi:fibronectin type 3 domain-containing protein
MQGTQGNSTLTTTVSGGFNGAISLSSSGAPSGTTVSFNPATIPAPGSGTSVMTITVGSTTRIGTYPITVTATNGSTQHTATVTLTVTGQIALSWTASQGAVGYNIYCSTTSGGPYTKINTSLDSNTTYDDQAVQDGVTYYYVTTAVNSQGLESSYSNQASAMIP